MPLYYNYGIGSYGINCWRELFMHIKTTNYVLNGECKNFPLLYHYRIIEIKPENIKFTDYKYWNSNKNIKEYMSAKSKSKYRIVLFIEYFPKVVNIYLLENKKNIHLFYNQSLNVVNFLNLKKIIHFDTHNQNFVVDSNNEIYLTDFGLVLDKEFKLSKKELLFYDNNEYYDYGLLYCVCIWYLVDIVGSNTNKLYYRNKLNIIFTKNTDFLDIENKILINYKFIFNREKIKKPSGLTCILKIFEVYNNFLQSIRNNNKKIIFFQTNK